MPTAARLTAAILFGVLALVFAYMASPYFPEAQQPDYWYPLNAAVGVIAGWMLCGMRAGSGYRTSFANGITAGAGVLFWVYFLMSFADMVKKSLRKSYDGPIEALINVFQIMLDWGREFMILDLGILMLVGSIVAGLITEYVDKRLP